LLISLLFMFMANLVINYKTDCSFCQSLSCSDCVKHNTAMTDYELTGMKFKLAYMNA
jgi:hypothetical protein